MPAISYTQVRKGMVIAEEGELFYIVDRDLNTPGNWRAILQLRVRNLTTGHVTTRRVRPEDKVEQALLDKREMQYIYQDGDGHVFMDTATFDQTTLSPDWAGELMKFVKEGARVHVVFHDGRPLSLELPTSVDLVVAETEASQRGNAQAQYKGATLETGLKVSVPPFILAGETISVDTRTGEYLGRAARES